jgi:hypothetical protein
MEKKNVKNWKKRRPSSIKRAEEQVAWSILHGYQT